MPVNGVTGPRPPVSGPRSGSVSVARNNYGFEKRQRELLKERKKEEKRQRKLERKNTDQASDSATEATDETSEADSNA
jgi:hypothetical protein